MPFVVTTTHSIPDDAPVTADMLSDVLRPSRWAGLPDGTATTARVDFVPALPAQATSARAGICTSTLERFESSLAASIARAAQPGRTNHRHPSDPRRRYGD